jgi:TRAP-type C4-dicarboxylate transport system permease small subunit
MDRAMRWLEGPMTLVMWLAILAGLLMMVHVSVDVIGRTVFNNPFEGTSEIVTYYYMVTAAYLPWMWLAKTDGHIKVDLFVRMLPSAVAFWLDVVVKLGLVAYLGLFTWQTWLQAIRQTERSEVQQAGTLYLPVWPTRWLLPLAGGLMALWVVLAVAQAVLKRRR